MVNVLPTWLPNGAIAHLDFVNGHYYAGGSEQSVNDILDFTSGPAIYAAPAIITADGLGHDGVSLPSCGANFKGPLASDVMGKTSLTLVASAIISAGDIGRGSVIAESGNNYNIHFSFEGGEIYLSVWDNNGPDSLEFHDANLDVVSRIATTFSPTNYRASANGAVVRAGSMGSPESFQTGKVGCRFETATSPKLRTITVYPAFDLVALSALS